MGDVFIKISAEEKQAVDAIMRVVRAQNEIVPSAKKATEAWKEMEKQTNDAAKRGQEAMANTKGVLLNTLPALGAVTAAVGTLGQVFDKEFERMTQKVQNFIENASALKKSLALSGEMELMPEVKKQLYALGRGRFDEKQMGAIFGAVQEQGGDELSMQQKLEAVGEATLSERAGKDPIAFAKAFAELRKNAPGQMSKDDLSEVTSEFLKANKGKGPDDTQSRLLNRWMAGAKASGASEQDAWQQGMGLLIGAAKGDESAKTIASLLEESDKTIEPGQYKGSETLSPENEARKKSIQAQRLDIDAQQLAINQAAKGGKLSRGQQATMNNLRLQDQALSLELGQIDSSKTTTQTADQQRLERLSKFEAGPARLAAMMKDPSLASDSTRLALQNVMDNGGGVNVNDIINGREYGGQLATGLRTQNSSRVEMANERARRANVRKAYQMSNPSAADAQAVANSAEYEERMASDTLEGGALRAMDVIPGMSSLARAKGRDLGTESETAKAIPVTIKTTRPVVSRNGGN
jgi:hypothetical protein